MCNARAGYNCDPLPQLPGLQRSITVVSPVELGAIGGLKIAHHELHGAGPLGYFICLEKNAKE